MSQTSSTTFTFPLPNIDLSNLQAPSDPKPFKTTIRVYNNGYPFVETNEETGLPYNQEEIAKIELYYDYLNMPKNLNVHDDIFINIFRSMYKVFGYRYITRQGEHVESVILRQHLSTQFIVMTVPSCTVSSMTFNDENVVFAAPFTRYMSEEMEDALWMENMRSMRRLYPYIFNRDD